MIAFRFVFVLERFEEICGIATFNVNMQTFVANCLTDPYSTGLSDGLNSLHLTGYLSFLFSSKDRQHSSLSTIVYENTFSHWYLPPFIPTFSDTTI